VLINVLQYGFCALAVILQMTVGVLTLWQKLHRQFPVFFGYTVFQVFRSVALFSILRLKFHIGSAYSLYFNFYWITDAICIALSLLLIYEVFRNLFHDYPLARQIASATFIVGTIGLLAFDIYLTTAAPGHEPHHLLSLILLLDRNLAVIQTGLVLVLFFCVLLMALPWRTNLSFGIGLGLGILEIMDVVAVSARARFGAAVNDYYATGKMFAYALAVVVWFVYILPPRPVREICADLSPISRDADDWNEALTDVLK
jgi:hypothetical protein